MTTTSGGEVLSDAQCRITKYGSYNSSDFNRISCAYCYQLLVYVINGLKTADLWFTIKHGYLVGGNQTLDPTRDTDVRTIQASMSELQYEKWHACCGQAARCCTDVMMKSSSPILDKYTKEASCQSIWDGWSCHPTTLAGQTSLVECPPHSIENTCNSVLAYASFKCLENGEWFRNQFGEWVDYGPCAKSIIPIKERSIYVNIITQSISLTFLLLGLIIFFCYRITLHKNFFISLILHSTAQIIWESVIMKRNLSDPEKYINSNHPGCIIINVLVQYTRSTNYFWMFCESLYLHKLLVTVFKEDSSLRLFYFIGWGIPFILCCIYSLCTFFMYNHSCWTQNIYLMYILTVPNILTILLNFVFLINVIRVLYKKLTASNTNEPHQYRRAVRATIILVPLFGLHLILSPIVLCDSTPGSQLHNLMNRLIESLQGFVVAIIYCFLNAEVTTLLKKTIIESKPFKALIYDDWKATTTNNHRKSVQSVGGGETDEAANIGAGVTTTFDNTNSSRNINGQTTTTTSDMDYTDETEQTSSSSFINPFKRLKRSLLRTAMNHHHREPVTREYRMSLSAPRGEIPETKL